MPGTAPPVATEHEGLRAFLRQQHDGIRNATFGLTDDQAHATPSASAICLAGVVKHVTNCERIQKGLESGAKDHMNLQDGEFMIRHHQETLRKWVNAATVADAMK